MTASNQQRAAFTLIELMAVVLLIAVLVAASIGAARYVSERAKVVKTKAQLAALEVAIEGFKSDFGYYPTSSIVRLSYLAYPVQSNSWMLYEQLTAGPKKYISLRPDQLVYDGFNRVTYIVDAWANPIVYYNPATNFNSEIPVSAAYNLTPGTDYELTGQNYYTLGGKVNAMTFDLFSYGPDKMTYIRNAPAPWGVASAVDDIWSGK